MSSDTTRVHVARVREALGATQEAYSEQIGCHPKYLGEIERHQKTPSLDLCLTIAETSPDGLEIERDGRRFQIREIRPRRSVVLNRIDRSPAAILWRHAEELREGAERILSAVPPTMNRIREVDCHVEELADMVEQALCDVETACQVVREWFAAHRPDVLALADERHRQKLWDRGYAA